ncbi:uncharacterized protein C2orf42 homolog isoform X2 [Uloborus diversus]|nr:uncharacterized protein C2orf42 homolog isoform X2 [Uloborus diversus]
MTERSKLLFEDLGRPTLRGVRKCPKCGTFNGTRGVSCKNKDCRLIFKAKKENSRTEPDAVKINSGRNLQIYSVKISDGIEEMRSFVHLPIIEGIEALQDAAEVTVIKRSAAVCYAPSCRKPMEDITTITLNLNPCSHTELVVNCNMDAEPLTLKKIVLKVMPVAESIKEEILSLALKSDDQLVQRVSKNSMVVRCHPDEQHPLGLLHFSVFEPLKNSRKCRILCGCQSEVTKPFIPKEKQMCMHFYMCVCAFASDAKLSEEFKPLVQSVFFHKLTDATTLPEELNEISSGLKVLKDFLPEDIFPSPKRKKNDSHDANVLPLMQENSVDKTIKSIKKGCNQSTKKQNLDEVTASFTFEQWLSSITEKINQTMHYQFNGNPDPLIFQAPQVFFEVLQQRISAGSKKKRLPNSVVAFTRKDSLPLGVFSKYTWHITNILHLKQIFDTPEISLEVTRSFIENRDGTYIPYEPIQNDKVELAENFRKTLNNLFIKPLELKTYLKVGTMNQDQKQPIPFIVEWIPDILPKSHIGELRIKFEYGHQRNGMIENRGEAPSPRESQSTQT